MGFGVSYPVPLISLISVKATNPEPRTPNLVPYTLIKLFKGTGYEVRGSTRLKRLIKGIGFEIRGLWGAREKI